MMTLLLFLFKGVNCQNNDCFNQNRCSQRTGIFSNLLDCCSLIFNTPSDCQAGNTADRCNVYFRAPGEACTPCTFIGFNSTNITLSESDTTYQLPIVIERGSPSFFDLTPSIGDAGTTAQQGGDYVFNSQRFDYDQNFIPSDTTVDITIRRDDVALEPTEVIVLNLVVDAGHETRRGTVFGRHQTTIIIEDTDTVTASLDMRESFIEISEGQNASLTITKNKNTATPLRLKLTLLTYQVYNTRRINDMSLPELSNISSRAIPTNPAENDGSSKDFNADPIFITLSETERELTVSINLACEDMIAEDTEGYVLILESAEPDPRVLFNTAVAIVQINDNDVPFIVTSVTSSMKSLEPSASMVLLTEKSDEGSIEGPTSSIIFSQAGSGSNIQSSSESIQHPGTSSYSVQEQDSSDFIKYPVTSSDSIQHSVTSSYSIQHSVTSVKSSSAVQYSVTPSISIAVCNGSSDTVITLLVAALVVLFIVNITIVLGVVIAVAVYRHRKTRRHDKNNITVTTNEGYGLVNRSTTAEKNNVENAKVHDPVYEILDDQVAAQQVTDIPVTTCPAYESTTFTSIPSATGET